MPDPDFISYCNVLASGRGITQTDQGKRVLNVSMADIKSISLRHGCASHRPLLELIVGAALLGVGIWGVSLLIFKFVAVRYDMMFIFLGVIGFVMIVDVAQRRYFFEIIAKNQTTKISFSKKADIDRIREFCSEMGRRWNYEIRGGV